MMAIRSEAEGYFSTRPREKDLAVRLDECFDLTHGRPKMQMGVWVADPKPHIRARFGFQQELLVIYSPFVRTDARVLTLAEKILNLPEFKHRLEKVVCLLIHDGNAEKIDDLLQGQRERIVVPIRSEELMDPARGSMFLSSRMAHVIGSVDLFGVSSPIASDKYFFGRDELVQHLINKCVSQGENAGLFGLRKTGKTSVLFAIERRVIGQPVLVQYIDSQNPGIHGARWWQVLEAIARRCSISCKRLFGASVPTHIGYDEQRAGAYFADDVSKILSAAGLTHLLIALDEVEYVTHGLSGALGRHWDQDFVPFWQTIRSVHQENAGKFSFIVAGVNPACVEKSHFGVTPNPIFQLAPPLYLEPLVTKHVRSMVRTIGRYTGLSFEERVYEYLQQTYGGHPYLIRLACSVLWQSMDTRNPKQLTPVSVDAFKGLRAEIIKARLAQPIKDILLSLVWWYPEEYDLLQILASGDQAFVKDYLDQNPESVVQFAKYGILRAATGEFAIADVQEFLKSYGDLYKQEVSPFTRSDLPPELLPEVPDLKELGKLWEKRSEVEVMLRRVIVLYLGVKTNWDPTKMSRLMVRGISKRKERERPEDLFVGRSPQEVANDLYTTDLKYIVLENWDDFGALFDNNQSRFEMNMDTMNLGRRADGHTKPITAEQVIEYNSSYSWLKAKMMRVGALSSSV